MDLKEGIGLSLTSHCAANTGTGIYPSMLRFDDDILSFIVAYFLDMGLLSDGIYPSLLRLDDDILDLIVGCLLDTGSLLDGLSMSLVCQRLRRISLSSIFRDVRWPQQAQMNFYPQALWPYIRKLTFTQTQWISRHQKSLSALTKALPDLSNLVTFSYSAQGFGPTLAFVTSLATSSICLTTLELSTVFFSHDALPLFSTFSGLHRISIKQPEGTTLLSAPEAKRTLSIQCVANLVLACHATLSHLELPGEFCPLSSFASDTTTLSALQTFNLHGYPPLNSEEFPMWKVIRSMPRLSTLEVSCRLSFIGARSRRYILMPHDVPLLNGSVSVFPSQLERLSISNPSMKDRLFKHLPPSLNHLFLDFVPDWENMLSSKDSLAYHRPSEMLGFLSRIQRVNSAAGIPNLESLCIKMGWCATPEILACICSLFPNLKSLELQGLRYVDRAESGSDMDACIAGLENLRFARTLKLAMELPEDSYDYAIDTVRNIGSVEQSAQKWANALALHIPTLELLAFETRPHTGRGLGPRFLIGPPSWKWFVIDPGSATARRVRDVGEGLPAEEPKHGYRPLTRYDDISVEQQYNGHANPN